MIAIVFKVLCFLFVFGVLVWRVYLGFRNSDNPRILLWRWIFTFILVASAASTIVGYRGFGPFAPILLAGICILIGLIWAPIWGAWIASPLTSMYSGGEEGDKSPLYSIAEARRKRGRYREAVEEIEKQLESFPDDLTGTLLLVDVFAKDLGEMRSAQYAVESYLAQGPHHPKNSFLALAHLADAYLSQTADREAAQRCFERIEQLCPDTEQAMIAAQRLAHLASDRHLEAKNEPKRIVLKQYDRRIGLKKASVQIHPNEKSPEQLADEYIQQLQIHPLDLDARENLALLYANHYGRLDMALEQLEMLVHLPNQPTRQIVRWMNRMADLHIKMEGNVPAARACLERVCEKFPNTAHAAQASKRKHFLELEKKGRREIPEASDPIDPSKTF